MALKLSFRHWQIVTFFFFLHTLNFHFESKRIWIFVKRTMESLQFWLPRKRIKSGRWKCSARLGLTSIKLAAAKPLPCTSLVKRATAKYCAVLSNFRWETLLQKMLLHILWGRCQRGRTLFPLPMKSHIDDIFRVHTKSQNIYRGWVSNYFPHPCTSSFSCPANFHEPRVKVKT